MGEENRGSSGSGTMVIVLAILAGILVLGCCGGAAALAFSVAYLWASPSPAMQQNIAPPPTMVAPEEAPPQIKPEEMVEPNLDPNLGPGPERPADLEKLGTVPHEAKTEVLEKKE